ncbi:Conserved hypothetical protein [Candidatus Phytoplasma australiense]|uniref:Uncharacterized protein n=2 Tax=Phytoplasma australiense TaxID=59748 RepID=B1V981_PHYAS|nr:hypothetical protein [Candidatus Phytoplasma australiense]AGL90657.1 hypothetical protein SLY_0742 [Strawberry lethal yellows phytoplasma (CPA) str. NZSb11]CAM11513.1 Conserved hypothetical protein [Candidatus Phytoplasma australiense]
MFKNNNTKTIVFNSPLQKYVIASVLFGLTIVLEFIGSAKFSSGIGSLFKMALVPLILIGFLLGLKYSLIFATLYACFHILKAFFYSNLMGYMEINGLTLPEKLSVLLLDYFLVDMAYGLSGLLYLPNFSYFNKYKKIWSNLFIIFSLVLFFKFIASRFIWLKILLETIQNNNDYSYPPALLKYPNILCLFYNIIPVLNNFLITGFIFSFLNPRLKMYLQNK